VFLPVHSVFLPVHSVFLQVLLVFLQALWVFGQVQPQDFARLSRELPPKEVWRKALRVRVLLGSHGSSRSSTADVSPMTYLHVRLTKAQVRLELRAAGATRRLGAGPRPHA
jgi:hypothetical protein